MCSGNYLEVIHKTKLNYLLTLMSFQTFTIKRDFQLIITYILSCSSHSAIKKLQKSGKIVHTVHLWCFVGVCLFFVT